MTQPDTNTSTRKKPKRKDYPLNGLITNPRYEIKYGKFGTYIYDSKSQIPLTLDSTVEKLNRLELRTKQLRWYVESYGEV